MQCPLQQRFDYVITSCSFRSCILELSEPRSATVGKTNVKQCCRHGNEYMSRHIHIQAQECLYCSGRIVHAGAQHPHVCGGHQSRGYPQNLPKSCPGLTIAALRHVSHFASLRQLAAHHNTHSAPGISYNNITPSLLVVTHVMYMCVCVCVCVCIQLHCGHMRATRHGRVFAGPSP